ncbi:MAG: hypothetical protein MZU84_04465 [Sphingobacterium sp.]|nr:hypothetical protein [Sphingobacterium sp.]
MPVGIVNWSVTQPVRDVRGYLVSDQFERRCASVVDVENIGVIWPQGRRPGGGDGRRPRRAGAAQGPRRSRRTTPRSSSPAPARPTGSTSRLRPRSDARGPSRLSGRALRVPGRGRPLLPPVCRARGVRRRLRR